MRIDLRDEDRRRIGRIQVDPALRPTRVAVTGREREVFLDWEVALDDGGHLRRCVACGCPDLFRDKQFPQVTGLVVVLAFALAVVGTLGLATTPPMFAAMGVVFVLDVAVLLFARRRLVCYRCRSAYHGLPIARYHRGWDSATAQHYPAPARTREPTPESSPTESPAAPRRRRAKSVRGKKRTIV